MRFQKIHLQSSYKKSVIWLRARKISNLKQMLWFFNLSQVKWYFVSWIFICGEISHTDHIVLLFLRCLLFFQCHKLVFSLNYYPLVRLCWNFLRIYVLNKYAQHKLIFTEHNSHVFLMNISQCITHACGLFLIDCFL